jgi:hypothetical protein
MEVPQQIKTGSPMDPATHVHHGPTHNCQITEST